MNTSRKSIGAQPPETHSFQYAGATITLARRTNRHALAIDRVMLAIGDPGDDAAAAGYKRLYARAVAQTAAIDGDLPVTLPNPDASAADLRAGYDAFLDADGELGDAYYQALNAVNAPRGPRAFLPPDELSDTEKKASPPRASTGGASDDSSSAASPAKKSRG